MQATRTVSCLVLLAAMLVVPACASRQSPPPVLEPEGDRGAAAGRAREVPPSEVPPPAAPAERILSLCVIDTAVWGGIRSLPVAVRAGTADTLAVVGERRVPLDSIVRPVTVLPETPWRAANQPLALQIGATRVEFSPYGPGRLIEPAELAFIGTFRGLPLFAAAEDVRGVRGELEDASRAGADLDAVLGRNARLRERFQAVQVLYVPIRRTGCVFQPFVRS